MLFFIPVVHHRMGPQLSNLTLREGYCSGDGDKRNSTKHFYFPCRHLVQCSTLLNPRAPNFFIYFCSARLLLIHTAQFVT